MMSKKRERLNVILTIMLLAECVCMIVTSFSIWTARTWYNNSINDISDSTSQALKDGSEISLCAIESVAELSKEDILVKRTVPDDMEGNRYFLCTLEVENAGSEPVGYLTLQAKNQNEDYISCYPIDYYQDIGNDTGEYHYGRMVFPEYTVSQYQVMLMLKEEQLKDMEELTIYEWDYDESEEEAPNYVSSNWEDVLTSSPVQ